MRKTAVILFAWLPAIVFVPEVSAQSGNGSLRGKIDLFRATPQGVQRGLEPSGWRPSCVPTVLAVSTRQSAARDHAEGGAARVLDRHS